MQFLFDKAISNCSVCSVLFLNTTRLFSARNDTQSNALTFLITCYALFFKSDWLVALLFLLK